MPAELLNGVEIRKAVLAGLAEAGRVVHARDGLVPGLATVLVGDNPASQSYVALKNRTAKEIGFHSVQIDRPATIGEDALLALIDELNADPSVHGILVQLPLPEHIRTEAVIRRIHPDKDVDGFHPLNAGLVAIGSPRAFAPCTPSGVLEMLKRADIRTAGTEVAIIGRSLIVGRPLALMMLEKAWGNAIVTVLHSAADEQRMAEMTRRADIVVAAAGKPNLVGPAWIKPGAVVIDVGITRVGVSPAGKPILRGDVDFEAVRETAGWITPVPGGVGPMTIAMLMRNTLRAALRSRGLDEFAFDA